MSRPRDMRTHPIGTGPFKFVEFKPNESVKVVRNADYWKPGRPYLDGIEYTLMSNPATAVLAFAAGKFDRAWQGIMSIPLMKQLKDQVPNAECTVVPWNIPRQMLVNRSKPPFDNAELRRAMVLTLDRRAFIDILSDGQGEIGGAMMPPPGGSWGMPPEVLQTLPGYGSDVAKNRAEAREIMKKLGYGPDKRLSVTVTTRDVAAYRDPAVLLIDQLKEIYIDGTLKAIDTTQWYPTVMRKDYMVALTVSENGLDDPDQQFYENFACGAERNYTGYCSAEVDQLIDRQSSEPDTGKRKQIVWEIERKLAEDAARPALFYPMSAACWQPHFKGHTMMVNGNYNGWRTRGRLARQIDVSALGTKNGRETSMKRHLRSYAATTGLLLAVAATPPAFAQKSGGILRQYIIDSPASMSIHEETTVVAERPMMAVMNNLGHVRPAHCAEQSCRHRPRSRYRLGLGRGWHEAGFPSAPGCQMARREAIHRGRRQMHLGPDSG